MLVLKDQNRAADGSGRREGAPAHATLPRLDRSCLELDPFERLSQRARIYSSFCLSSSPSHAFVIHSSLNPTRCAYEYLTHSEDRIGCFDLQCELRPVSSPIEVTRQCALCRVLEVPKNLPISLLNVVDTVCTHHDHGALTSYPT